MRIQQAENPPMLHLTSLTEEAVPRLVADNGLVIRKVATTLLESMEYATKLLELKTSEINVTITAPTKQSSKKGIFFLSF